MTRRHQRFGKPRPFGHTPAVYVLNLLALLSVQSQVIARVEADSSPVRISVHPADVALSGAGAQQQLAVTGWFADGSVRDVSRECRFAIEGDLIASVTPSGIVMPRGDGHTWVHIEVNGRACDVSVAVTNARAVRPVSYRLDVVAILSKAGCNMGACHGNLNGKGGFKLSLRGDDPRFDHQSLTRDTFSRRVNTADPARSLFVLKPTGQTPHEGGPRFRPGSPEAAALIAWIAHGAHDDSANAPAITRLTVFPEERIALAPSLGQQLVVTAEFSDGTRRDVTRQASYDVDDPTKTSVSADGQVERRAPGETTVAVRYLKGRAVSRLAFLADRPDFVWADPPANNELDTHVFATLKALRINPSELSNDTVFLRRSFLDAIGKLPTPDEARAFLADRDPHKRDKLIDRLVNRPEFADFWALKWADLLRNEEMTMGSKGVWIFQRWLRDQIARDLPLDELTRQLVTGLGSTWKNPPASFYRTNRDPMTCAESVGQVFLGVRLQCARCHNHPFDVWTQDDYYGLAAFFGNIARKEINNVRRDRLDKHEINGDEIIYLSGRPGTVQPRSGTMMEPKPPRGPKPALGNNPDALDDLARWLTRDNPQFTRNMANRVWFHLLGRGVVEPVDDFRDSNPPSNPALLDALARVLVANGMRLKPFVALIMKSHTYQLDAKPSATNADDESHFARAAVRLLPAEVLLDAIGDALGQPESFANAPRGANVVQLPGARMGGQFLKVFGKPDRLLTCECERSDATTLAQAFQMINGDAVRRKLDATGNRIGRLLGSGASNEAILNELSLAILSHEPSGTQASAMLAHVSQAADRRKAWEDLAWAMLNSKEFLLKH